MFNYCHDLVTNQIKENQLVVGSPACMEAANQQPYQLPKVGLAVLAHAPTLRRPSRRPCAIWRVVSSVG